MSLIRVASDLHVDYHRDKGASLAKELTAGDFDVLVVAGDIAERDVYGALSTFAKACRGRPMVYVPGNHDFWGRTRARLRDDLARAEADNDNLVTLDMREAEVGGVHIVGAPLWYPLPASTLPPELFVAAMAWCDLTEAKDIADWLEDRHAEEAAFIEQRATAASVVVTHFLPHPWSIHEEYKGAISNMFYLRDMSTYIETSPTAPRLWVHGHTHRKADYKRGHTRVVCNPFGYLVEGQSQFDADKTIPMRVVEAAGIEPASGSSSPKRLRA